MKFFSSLSKMLVLFFLIFSFSLFFKTSKVDAAVAIVNHGQCSNGTCTCTSNSCGTDETCYVVRQTCSDPNVAVCTDNPQFTNNGSESVNSTSCGVVQVDMGCRNAYSVRTIGWTSGRMTGVACQATPAPCPMDGTKSGNLTYRSGDCATNECNLGKLSSACSMNVCAGTGDVGCGRNGCDGKMAVCGSGGTLTCTTSSMCSGGPSPTPSPTPGTWGACGCYGSGECVDKPNNEGPTHPASECRMSPEGVCKWDPASCGGGTQPTPTPVPKSICGEKCVTNADCAKPTGSGVTVSCRAGICQADGCPDGKTENAPNCACTASDRLCGQKCGSGYPLCAPGSVCTFIDGPTCSATNAFPSVGTDAHPTYCVSTVNKNYGSFACNAGTFGQGNRYLKNIVTNKDKGFSKAEILQTCSTCGNGIVDVGEQCDEGSMNGYPSSSCDSMCKKKSTNVCGSACRQDDTCNQHIVKLVARHFKSGTVDRGMFILDAVEDNLVRRESSATDFFYTGAWDQTAKSTRYVDGFANYTSEEGASVSFPTSSQSINLITQKRSDAGLVDVYVDGVLKQTIDLVGTGTSAAVAPIAVQVYAPSNVEQTVVFTNVHASTTKKRLCIDYLMEDGVKVENTSSRITYTLANSTSKTKWFVNGTYTCTDNAGDYATIKSKASAIALTAYIGTATSKAEVKVNGVVYETFDFTTTSASGARKTLSLQIDAKGKNYVCQGVTATQTGVCRLRSNPTSTTCGGTAPTPTPSALVCDLTVSWSSNADRDNWKFGDQITFSVAQPPSSRVPAGSTVRYEGEITPYRGTTKLVTTKLEPINATASQFKPYTLPASNAKYYFRFRYCVKYSNGTEQCSNWGDPQLP